MKNLIRKIFLKPHPTFPEIYERASPKEKHDLYYRMAQEANKEQINLMKKYQ